MQKLKNEQVVTEFLNRKEAQSHTGALWSTGDCLFSYGTIIAQWQGTTLWVNVRGYSSTTRGQHQSQLKRHLDRFTVRYVNGVDLGVRDLTYYETVDLEHVSDKYWQR